MHEEHAELLRAVDPAALGARVRSARISRGLTQTQLGGDGVSTGYVSRIESGARRPTLTVLSTLAARLDTTLDHLLRGVTGTECEEIRLALDYAELAVENGEAADAEHQARRALEQAEAGGLVPAVRRAQVLLARALEIQGRLDDAIDLLEAVTAVTSGLDLIDAGIALSRCHREAGDLDLAIEVGERIESATIEAGLERTDGAVRLAMTIAAAYSERGDLHQAARRCRLTLERAESLDSPGARSAAYWNASIVHEKRGDIATAVRLADRALALLGEGGDARNLARLRSQRARLLVRDPSADLDEAFGETLRARSDLIASSASAADLNLNRLTLAQAHLRSGDPELAVAVAYEALQECPYDAVLNRVEAFAVLGEAQHAAGDTAAAHTSYRSAAELLAAVGGSRAAAQLWFDLARLLEDAGDQDRARDAYRRAGESMGLRRRSARPVRRPVGQQQ